MAKDKRGGRRAGGSSKTESVDVLKEKRKEIQSRLKEIARSSGGEFEYGSPEHQEWERLQDEKIDIDYKLYTSMSPTVTEERFNELNKEKGAKTDLNVSEVAVVRKDMLKNKDIFTAISKATAGVTEGQDTELDIMYKGKNGQKLYKTFESTRNMLRKKYGDTVTLYRAGTDQTPKSTINMTTKRSNAQQYGKDYGTRVFEYKVPVSDVLAANISRNGQYEEFVIINRKGNLNKKSKR